jgi:hypothetical protein
VPGIVVDDLADTDELGAHHRSAAIVAQLRSSDRAAAI